MTTSNPSMWEMTQVELGYVALSCPLFHPKELYYKLKINAFKLFHLKIFLCRFQMLPVICSFCSLLSVRHQSIPWVLQSCFATEVIRFLLKFLSVFSLCLSRTFYFQTLFISVFYMETPYECGNAIFSRTSNAFLYLLSYKKHWLFL